MRSLLIATALCIAFAAVHAAVTQTGALEDATVRAGIYANNNYGLEPTAYVKTNTPDETRWYYIKFPINNLVPIGTNRVVIRLFGYYQGTGFPITVAAWSVPDDSWSQSTITWNNKPSPLAILSSEQVAHPIAWYEWDVTTYVRNEINLGNSVASFAFIASNVTSDLVLINSLEADVSRPLLVVVAGTPTQSVLNPSDDAYVRGGAFSSNNYGLLPDLVIQDALSAGNTRLAYLKFPLNNLVPITTQSVVLRVYGAYDGLVLTLIDAYSVPDTTWTQNTITYNTRPALGSFLNQQFVFTSDGWVEFDVTAYVKARQLAAASSISFALVGNFFALFTTTFNSLEAPFNQPQLSIVPLIPTVSTVTPLEDASVRSGAYCNQNYALDATAYVRNAATPDDTWQYFVKFPLSNLATLSPGQTYKIRLFGYYEGTTLTVSANSVNDNSWSQGSITFCNKPVINTLLSSTAVNHPIGWYEWDVTSYVTSRKTGGFATASFAFLGTTTSTQRFLINSLESDVNNPQLTIV